MNQLTQAQTTGLANSSNLDALFTEWNRGIEGTDATKATYNRNVKQFIQYLYDNGINQPTEDDVRAYRDSLLEAGCKPTTINSYIQAVRVFFKWAEKKGYYQNIGGDVKGVRLDEGFKKEPLTATQAKELLQSIDRSTLQGLRDYAICSLMLCTGLRTVEVVRADLQDLRTVADFVALFVQGKGHSERTQYVKVPEAVEKALREYLKARAEIQGEAKDTDPLFISLAHKNYGQRMTTRSISRICKQALIAIGLNDERHTAHAFRHTTATLNLLAGGTPEETMQLLRHKNLNTTLIYSHYLDKAKSVSEQRVADSIF